MRGGTKDRHLFVLIMAGTLAAQANPWLGPIRTSGDRQVGPPGGRQEVLRATPGGDLTLVTWHDHLTANYQAIVGGSLIRSDGTVVTPYGIRITPGLDDDVAMGASFDGTNFMVFWTGPGMYVTRVSPQGVVLDPQGVPLPDRSLYGGAIAFDGTNHLVVWGRTRSGFDIVAARVSPAGVVLDASPIVVSSDAVATEREPAVACGGGTCLVTWEARGSNTIRGALVAPNGTVSPELALSTAPGSHRNPAVAFGGGAFVVTWEDDASGSLDVHARGVSPAGVLDPASLLVAGGAGDQWGATVAFDGTAFFVTFADEAGELKLSRLSSARALVDPAPLRLTTRGTRNDPWVVATPSTRLVVWQDFQNSDGDAFAARILPNGALQEVSGFPVVVSAQRHTAPAAASLADAVFFTWESYDRGTRTLEAAVDDGRQVRSLSLPVSMRPRSAPSASAGPGATLLAYREEDDVFVLRVGPDGLPQGAPLGVSGSDCAGEPRAAPDGSGWLVVWTDCRLGSTAIFGARVSAAGMASPAGGFRIVAGSVDRSAPRVACLASGTCLVVFREPDVERVGAVLVSGTSAGMPFSLTALGGKQVDVDVATDGAGFLAVWRDSRASGSVLAVPISATGQPRDLIGQPVIQGVWVERLTLAWSGERYLVAWQQPLGARLDVVGAWIEPDGVPSPDLPFPLADGPTEDAHPHLAGLGGGRLAMAWVRRDESPDVNTLRVAVRRISEVRQGATCSFGAECASGQCIDGVCCDGPCGGGVPGDCEACSVAAGAARDGVCGVARAGTTCRASAGACDVEEVCDGAALVCGADQSMADGSPCPGGVCRTGRCERTDRPVFTSVPQAALTCGRPWGYSVGGGAPEVAGAGPFVFSVRTADGSALPEGFSVDAETGALTWTPTPAQVGTWDFVLKVESPAGSDEQRLRAEVGCRNSTFGVGCASTGGGLAWALAALLAPRRRRAPRR